MKNDLNLRRPQSKTTSMEDDLNERRPLWKTISMEDDIKEALQEADDISQPICNELGPAQPQLVLVTQVRHEGQSGKQKIISSLMATTSLLT